MVKITRPVTAQVAPAVVPGAALPRGASPDAFGAGLGKAAEEIAKREADFTDRQKAYESVRAARETTNQLWWGEGGGREKEGEDFQAWSKEAEKRYDEALESATRGLTPMQTEYARADLDGLRDRFVGRVMERGESVRHVLAEGGMAANLDSIFDDAMIGLGTEEGPALMARALEQANHEIGVFIEEHSEYIPIKVADWRRLQTEEFESRLVKQGIEDALKSKNPRLAEGYLEKYGDKLGPARASVAASVQGASALAEGSEAAEIFMAANPILVGGMAEERAAEMNAHYRPPMKQVAHIRKEVKAYMKEQGHDTATADAAAAHAETQALGEIKRQEAVLAEQARGLLAELQDAGGDWTAVQASNPFAWDEIGRQNQDALKAEGKVLLQGRVRQEQADLYASFLSMADSPDRDKVQAFVNTDLTMFQAQLGPQYEELKKVQEKRLKGINATFEDGLTDTQRIEMFTEDMSDDEVALFKNVYSDAVMQLQQTLPAGRDTANAAEKKELLERMSAEVLWLPFDAPGGRPRVLDLGDPLYKVDLGDISLTGDDGPSVWWKANKGAEALVRNAVNQEALRLGVHPDDVPMSALPPLEEIVSNKENLRAAWIKSVLSEGDPTEIGAR